jgi:hypothetical protein
MFLPGWPSGNQRLVNPCALLSIGQTWVLASNDAVLGDLISTMYIEKTAYGV